MKNWIKGLIVAVVAMGIGIGQLNASPEFIAGKIPVVNSVDSIGIEDSFVSKPSTGRSGGSFSRSSGGWGSSKPSTPPSSKSSGTWGSKPSTPKSGGLWGSKPSTPPKVVPAPSSSSSSTKSSGSWWGSSSKSKPVAPANKTASSVDSKVNSSTKSTGKTFSSKESAVSSFKAANAKETAKGGKFTSHYEKEPATRPSHIPSTYNNHTVVYNPGMGGYGYWSGGGPGLGTWMMYDMMSDAVMLSAMSHNHGYYHGYGSPTYVGAGYVFNTFVVIIVLIVIILILTKVFSKNV